MAKRIEGDDGMTATGQALGTPSYMPPEQAAGRRGEIGPASDVYSLGAILYELLTGRPPFRAEAPLDTLMQVLENEPAPPRLLDPNVPRDLETICLKCLQKEPRARYASAAELAAELDRYLNEAPIEARPIGVVEQTWRRARKHHGVLTSIAAAILATLVFGTGICRVPACRYSRPPRRGLRSWCSRRCCWRGADSGTGDGLDCSSWCGC